MTPRKAYEDQRFHSLERKIEWQFTYTEWLELWLNSGKWHLRGKKKGRYQMCRYGDIGPYSIKNCYIASSECNQEHRAKVSISTVKDIVYEYLSTKQSQYEVAKKFNVDQSYVSRLVTKHRRKYGQDNSPSTT
jgi:hypothetical protein